MSSDVKKAIWLLVVLGGMALIAWGWRSCQHEQEMIASVKEWTFVENRVYSAWTEVQFIYHFGTNGQMTGMTPIFYNHPERRVSVWKGVDIEGKTRHKEAAWRE